MRIKLNQRQKQILNLLALNKGESAASLLDHLNSQGFDISRPTVNRDLDELVEAQILERKGSGPSTTYSLTVQARLLTHIDSAAYFEDDPDSRNAIKSFNWQIFELLKQISVFNHQESSVLESLHSEYLAQKAGLSEAILQKEIERITIELSWKSSAIEGNTYSLLETENLLKNGLPAEGKSEEETQMVLNHKIAINHIFEHAEQYRDLSVNKIEKIHGLLTKDLGIQRGVRTALVGITGTAYTPIDNKPQIEDALGEMVILINSTSDVFAKSLLSMLLTSYIQAFEDGNKRTSRLLGNAVLLAHNSFPLSFRSVDEVRYKEGLLLFYEQNNLSLFKEIYMEQAEFAVKNYFRSTA
jgi:Fic family protein